MDVANLTAQSSSPQPVTCRRLLSLALLLVVLFFGVFSAQAQRPEPFRIDHFLCYHVLPTQFAGPKGISVIDQFNVQPPLPVQVNGRDSLCNPVSKNGEPIPNKETHLMGYLVRLPADYKPLNKTVIVSNQFGENQRVEVLRPVKLLLPTGKALLPKGKAIQEYIDNPPEAPPIPKELDHYFCYTVKAEFKPRSVTISDQFDETDPRKKKKREVELIDFALLCNPAEKRIENTPPGHMFNNRDHLACYTLKPEAFVPKLVEIHNQFENRPVQVRRPNPNLLCVPSAKRLITTEK
jgi:hypothetical protein